MKKIKLLTALSSLSVIGMISAPLTSCSGDKTATHTITFECSEGVSLSFAGSITVNEGTKWKDVEKPTATIKDGYIDVGWYNGVESINDETEIKSDFKAKYIALDKTKTIVNVTIVTAKQTYSNVPFIQTLTWKDFKDYYGITEDPKKEQHVFLGWFTNNTEVKDDFIFESGKSEITIEAKFKSNFELDTWENVCQYANEGFDALKSHYNVNTFVGLERSIFLNGHKHIVKVIDEKHDILASDPSKTAALTFELFTLMSDKDGNLMKTTWAAQISKETGFTDNYDYPNSVLRKNISGNGTPSGSGQWSKSASEIFKEENANLYENLKNVTKQVATTSAYTIQTYQDKLFALTQAEMGRNTGGTYSYKTEGTPYKYWADKETKTEAKIDVNGNTYDYWLCTPDAEYFQRYKAATGDNNMNAHVGNEIGVSFGFCI